MKIEEAIQSKFADTNQKAIVNLLYTASWLSGRISEVLKKQGITHQQYNVLRILRGAKGQPVSLKYIRERMLDRMSDASRIVDKLHNKRYLERKQCPSDRRNVDITITNEGLSLLQKLDGTVEEVNDLFSNFTEEEVIDFNNFLDKLRQ